MRLSQQEAWLALATCGCLFLTVLLYWQGLNGVFILDDHQNIVLPYKELRDWPTFWYQLTHNASGMLGRSISVLSFMLTSVQFGIHPWGYKLHNLILHLLSAVVLFRFLYLLLPLLTQRVMDKNQVVIAGFVSAIWLLHPLQVSTVLYAVQRMTQLGAFFTLLTLVSYLEFRLHYGQGRRFWFYGWFWLPCCMLLAVLSKEIGALIPFYILAIEWLAFRTTPKLWQQHKGYACWLLVFVIAPLLVGSLFIATHLGAVVDYSTRTFTLSERLLTQAHVIPHYMQMILLPRLSVMNLFQDDFPVTHSWDLQTSVLALLLATLVVSIFLLRRKAPVIAFGLAWFFISHLLESTIIPLEMVFEHRNYLALAGLWLAVTYSVVTVAELKPARWLLAALLVLCAGMTFVRAREWSDEGLLLSQGVLDHPKSSRVRTTYANYLLANNRVEEGLEQLIAADDLRPDDAGSLLHRLHVVCLAEARDENALRVALTRLSQYPPSVYTFNSLENMINSVNKNLCKKLTRADMHKLVDTAINRPGSDANLQSLGYLYRLRGILALNDRSYAEGVIAYRKAHEYTGQVDILAELVELQVRIGRLEDAADTLDLLQQMNIEKHGSETYQVNRVSKLLAKALEASAASVVTPEQASNPAAVTQ